MFFSHRRYIYHVNRSNSRQIWQSSLTKGSNSINNVRERRSIQLFRRSWFDPRGQNARCRVHDIVSVFVRVQLYSTAYIPVSNITGYKLWPQQGGRSKTRTTTAFGMRAYQTCVVDKVVVRSGTLEMCCGILEACYREISKGKGMVKKGEKKLGGGFSVERSCSSGWTAGWRPDDRDQRHLSRHLRGDKENSRTTVGRAG